jgi:spermidine synthase
VHVKRLSPLHIFALGCCGITAQSIFVREMMALFTGTELVIGVLFAGWLVWVGLGGLVGGRAVLRGRDPGFARFAGLTVLVAVLLPVTTVCIRLGRGAIATPPGAIPPFGPALAFSVIVMAPFAFTYGSIYNIASVLWRERGGGLRLGISRVYAWEAAGSVFGALLFSFVLLTRLSQLDAAVIVAFVLAGSVTLYPAGGAFSWRRGVVFAAAAACAVVVTPRADRASIDAVFPGYDVRAFVSSRYGELVVAARREVVSVFAGGGRLFSYPEPERTEEVVDIPLLISPAPRSVLLIGGSLGGGWEEALKSPTVDSLDCIELDGSLFRLALPTEAARPPGVRFLAADGRFFLASTSRRYDVVILDSPPPLNLEYNRFYTREFFEIARRRLAPGGMLALSHPSSEEILSSEQTAVLRSIEGTLSDVFPRVTVLPGSTTHFLAGEATFSPDSIVARLKERKIHAPFVSEDYLPFRFSRERMEELQAALSEAGPPRINTDAHPVLILEELALEGSKMRSPALLWFRHLLRIPRFAPAAALGVLLLLLLAGARRAARAPLAVWAVGFGSFLLQLLVLLSYQSFSGLLYYAIVLMTALFMAGASLGAWRFYGKRGAGRKECLAIHAGFIVLAGVLPAWTLILRHAALGYAVGSAGFLLVSLGGGFLTGSYYAVVVRTAFPEGGSAVPATFYAWDVFGACAAGLVGGVVFFPVVGLVGTACCIAGLHALTALFVAGRW